MIVDCFTFFDEFDLLELRLRILGGVVDRFVLCEAPFTFRGDPKPLHFASAPPERFARWRERITVLAYPGPADENPWQNEWGQRDYLATGLTGCASEDLILIGDCDEIPDPRLAAKRPRDGGILMHRMMYAQGYVNRVAWSGTHAWNGTRALTYANLARYGTLSNVRKSTGAEIEAVDGGWHFTSLGGAAAMERKIRAYSHVELDIPYFRDRRRLDVTYGSSEEMHWLPLDDRFPQALRDDARWQPFVLERPPGAGGPSAHGLAHAHGALAYVPADAAPVAVIANDAAAWQAAAQERLGTAFAGVFSDAPALLAAVATPDWVVVDRPEALPRGTLRALAAAGAAVVAFAANARSFEVFRGVLGGTGAFPAGRAFGRAEHEADIRAAGYRIVADDRVFSTQLAIPITSQAQTSLSIEGFAFAEIAAGALHDFLSNAFIFTLAPVNAPPPAAEH
jgi:beta-1,4-mannosyl-glycoprotein beta-1,4-N-acetylglucosaminyltransferase